MSEPTRWAQQNADYLAAAMTWLRARLSALAAEAGNDTEYNEWAETLAAASAALQALEECDPPPALVILRDQLGLSPFEAQLLLLCAAMEFDPSLAALCAAAQHDPAKRYPTFALALTALADPAWDALAPARPLRYWRLIEINQPMGQPLIAATLRADERIVHYLKGLNLLDDRFEALVTPMPSGEQLLPPSQQAMADALTAELQQAAATGQLPAVQLTGPHSASKRLIAGQVAARLGVQLFSLPAESLPLNPAELETFARLWQRESYLLPLALYVDAAESDPVGAQLAALKRLLTRSHGIFFLAVREGIADLSDTLPTCAITQPTATEQCALWAAALGSLGGDAPATLAAQFNLDPATIAQGAQMALLAGTDARAVTARLWQICRSAGRPRLEALAQRLEPVASWDDLVLPAETTALLHQLTDQVRQRLRVYDEWGFRTKMNRGLGISALFAGESGTGKTMAAEVLANDLGLDLYRIDLSAVVSKYIGETEKNLRRLFDAAEDGGAILLFDEADALFGKRSEVKDSHDRYANIEVNYLLQRMEGYRGLAVLATNMKSALDQAFMRRLRFIVSFTYPGQAERRRMWQRVFPPQAPLGELDYDQLARLNLTGGLIHNSALNAAFMAAGQEPSLITMPIVCDAIRGELRKLDKPTNGL